MSARMKRRVKRVYVLLLLACLCYTCTVSIVVCAQNATSVTERVEQKKEEVASTLSQNTTISLGLLVTIAGMLLAQLALAFSLALKANAAMPRSEAILLFVSKEESIAAHKDIKDALSALNAKLDRLIEREQFVQTERR